MRHRGKPAKNRRSVAAGSPDGAVLGMSHGDLEERYRSLVAEQSFRLGILQTIDGLFKGKLDPVAVSHAPAGAAGSHARSSKRLYEVLALFIIAGLLAAGAVYLRQASVQTANSEVTAKTTNKSSIASSAAIPKTGLNEVKAAQPATAATPATLTITQSSVNDGTTINATTQEITLNSDHPLAAADQQQVTLNATAADGTPSAIPITLTVNNGKLTVAVSQPLPQSASLTLTVTKLIGSDNSQLAAAYTVHFTTSGGPAVVSSNLPAAGMATNQAITITFNQPLASGQNPVKLAALKVNGITQRAYYSLSGSSLTLRPLSDYPACSTVTVEVTNTVQNVASQSGSSAWTGTGKVGC